MALALRAIHGTPAGVIRAPRHRKGRLRGVWYAAVRAVRGVVLLDDTPYRIAMGAACGIFSSVLPTIGQTFIGMAMAWAFRANVVASIPWSWISNPFTTLPIWYGCYLTGCALIPGRSHLGYDELARQVEAMQGGGWLNFLGEALRLAGDIFIPTLIGSLLIGVALGAVGFVAVRAAVRWMHARRALRSASWRDRLAAAHGAGGEPLPPEVPVNPSPQTALTPPSTPSP